MCFSNLPIEFDANGDPYLAEEAEDVERPDTVDTRTDEALDIAPQEAYEAILNGVPRSTRERLAGTGSDSDSGLGADHDTTDRDAVEGD